MAKDINYKINLQDADKAKQQLDDIKRKTEQTGATTEQSAKKSSQASEGLLSKFKQLAGGMGLAGLGAAAIAAGKELAKFFDGLKEKSDEAVRDVEALRGAYENLFEALGAFDEKSREKITKETSLLLADTGVSRKLGLPIVNEYTRQFKGLVDSGDLTPQQYDAGLRGMLGYGARHGGDATPELIKMMAGWGMTTPQQQGGFRRMISNAAASSGLTDQEVIGALGRAGPTMRAMGWGPAQAVENIAVLARGETGRKLQSMPAATIEAIGRAPTADLSSYGINERVSSDPTKLFSTLQQKRLSMDKGRFYEMLTKAYGTEAASGVYKLLTADRGDISRGLEVAAGPKGARLERDEETQRMGSLGAIDAVASNVADYVKTDVTTDEKYMEQVRQIGAAALKVYERRNPMYWLYQHNFIDTPNALKERAAFDYWQQNLPDQQRQQIIGEYSGHPSFDPLRAEWQEMSPQERFEGLRGVSSGSNVIINENNTIYNPRIGDDESGPRITQDY